MAGVCRPHNKVNPCNCRIRICQQEYFMNSSGLQSTWKSALVPAIFTFYLAFYKYWRWMTCYWGLRQPAGVPMKCWARRKILPRESRADDKKMYTVFRVSIYCTSVRLKYSAGVYYEQLALWITYAKPNRKPACFFRGHMHLLTNRRRYGVCCIHYYSSFK